MIKFKKDIIIVGLIVCLVSSVSGFSSVAEDISYKTCLRPPLLFQNKATAQVTHIEKQAGTDYNENEGAPDWIPPVDFVSLSDFIRPADLGELIIVRKNEWVFNNNPQKALDKLKKEQLKKLNDIIDFVSQEIETLRINIIIEPIQAGKPSIWYRKSDDSIHIQLILLTDLLPLEYVRFVTRLVFVSFAYLKNYRGNENEFSLFSVIRGRALAQLEGVDFVEVYKSWPAIRNLNSREWRWADDIRPKPVGYKEVECPFCGQDKYKVIAYINFSRVVMCDTCGLLRSNPQPIFYKNKNYTYLYEYSDLDVSRYVSTILKLCKKENIDIENKTILDLGCNSGMLLYTLWKMHGFNQNNLHGIDTFSEAVAYGKQKGLKNLTSKDIVSIDSGTYDVVILSSTIEHFDAPIKMLKEIKRILKPAGLLFILKVPNAESMLRYKLDKPAQFIAEYAEHYFHFDYITLTRVLKETGFKEIANAGAMMSDFNIYWDRDDYSESSLNHTFDCMARHFGVIDRNTPLKDYSELDYDPKVILQRLESHIKKIQQHLIKRFSGISGFEIFEIADEDFVSIKNFLEFLARTNFSAKFYGQDFSLLLQVDSPQPISDFDIKLQRGCLQNLQSL